MQTIRKDFKYRAEYPVVSDELDFAMGFVAALVIIAALLKVMS